MRFLVMIVTTNIMHINDYVPNSEDMLFFDANVWLTIYGPAPNHWSKKPCTSLYHSLIKNQIPIYTNTIIISEVINSWARLEFNQQRLELGFEPQEFKKYRESELFEDVAEEISIVVEAILRWSNGSDSNLESMSMDDIVSKYRTGAYDFNDLIFSDICKTNGFIFVTNDHDFCGLCETVLTANKKMLSV